MRSGFVVLMAALVSAVAFAESAPPEAWAPLRVFIGYWSGSRTGPEGSQKLSREYQTVPGNPELKIIERSGGHSSVWGVFSYDSEHQRLILLHQPGNGQGTPLPLDPSVSSSETRLIFSSAADAQDRTRVTYERINWNEFVERVEHAAPGQEFALVSEARFKRK